MWVQPLCRMLQHTEMHVPNLVLYGRHWGGSPQGGSIGWYAIRLGTSENGNLCRLSVSKPYLTRGGFKVAIVLDALDWGWDHWEALHQHSRFPRRGRLAKTEALPLFSL